MKKNVSILFVFLLVFVIKLKAQDPLMLFARNLIDFQNHQIRKWLDNEKDKYYQYANLRPAFNAFAGSDASLLSTTFRGLGSYSDWNLVFGYPFLVGSSNTKFLILPRTGVFWKKFRFANNLISGLDTTINRTVFAIDNDPNKDFGSGFFSYGKTKLVVPTYRINPEFGASIDVGEQAIGITVGPVLDIALGAKFKQKYKENGQKKKNVVRGNDNLNVNTIQYGISAAIITPFIQIYGAYMLNSFFKEDKGPSVNVFEFGLNFTFLK